MPRILYPEWPNENAGTKYPFAARATLTNGTVQLLIGTFADAVLFPIGGGPRLRLSKVVVTHADVTLYIGDQTNAELASGVFGLPVPPATVTLEDAYGRPAGFIISSSVQLGLFPSWGVGTYTFEADATEFAATVCIPTPEVGVRGILLDDGTLLTGDVWLVSDAGVVLRADEEDGAQVVRVDVVGDPLFRRRLCETEQSSLFTTPNFIKTVTFTDGRQSVIVTPDADGNVYLTVNNALAADTVLRIHPTAAGNVIEAVGSAAES